jgi:hypothetical protein
MTLAAQRRLGRSVWCGVGACGDAVFAFAGSRLARGGSGRAVALARWAGLARWGRARRCLPRLPRQTMAAPGAAGARVDHAAAVTTRIASHRTGHVHTLPPAKKPREQLGLPRTRAPQLSGPRSIKRIKLPLCAAAPLPAADAAQSLARAPSIRLGEPLGARPDRLPTPPARSPVRAIPQAARAAPPARAHRPCLVPSAQRGGTPGPARGRAVGPRRPRPQLPRARHHAQAHHPHVHQ